MPQEISFEDVMAGGGGTPEPAITPRSGELSFEDVMGQGADLDSDTPETSQALVETSMWEKAMKVARTTSPMNLIHQYNKAVIGLATNPPRIPGITEPIFKPDQEGKVPTMFGPSAPATAAVAPQVQPLLDPRFRETHGIQPLVRDAVKTSLEVTPVMWPTHLAAPELAKSVRKGVGEFAGGMTTTDNLAIMVATSGLGAAAPATRAISGAFAVDMGRHLPEQWKAFKEAPDLNSKVSIATQGLLTLATMAQAGKHAIKGAPAAKPTPKEETPDVDIRVPFFQTGEKGFVGLEGEAARPARPAGVSEEPWVVKGGPESPAFNREAAARLGGMTAEEHNAILSLQGKLQRGEITTEEYQSQARAVLQVGEEPIIEHEGFSYQHDPESMRFRAINDAGEPFQVIRHEEGPAQKSLVDALIAKRERIMGERQSATEPPKGETDARAEARANEAMKRLRLMGGEPEAVFRDLADVKGTEPTWGEFADALESDIARIGPTPEAAQRAYTEGIAKQRGITPEQLEAEVAAREEAGRARAYEEAKNAALSRREIAEEAKERKKGGKYAKQPSYVEVETGPPALRVETRPSGAEEVAGRRHYVEREAERGPARREVSPAQGRDLELLNRARRNVEVEHQLPKDPVELLKAQEADPGAVPSNAEIEGLVAFEYRKLLQKKRAAQKASEAAEKKAPEAEPAAPRGAVREPGETGIRPGVAPSQHPTKSGKPGLRETILNARDLGMTVDQYRRWRAGSLEFPLDAESIAERQKALGIKSQEAAPEAPKKGFRVRTALDDYANSPETPVAMAVNEMGGIKSKTAAQSQGKYEGNEALWDDVPQLKHPTHRKIYKPTGEMPDVAAQSLYDAGLIKEPSVREMNRVLEQESASIRARTKAAPEKGVSGKVAQAEKFGEGQRTEIEEGTRAIPAESLAVGDKVKVDNTELKVTKVEPNGDVTLENGKRYGVQEVAGDEVIYGEVETPGKAEAPAAAPGEKFSTKANFKKISDGRYEHKNTKLIISKGKEGGWDIRHPATGEVFDHQPTRQKAMQAYSEGQSISVKEQGGKLKLKANNEGGFINPEIFREAVDFGKRIYHKGMSYGKWARDMVKNLGKSIKDHLKNIWEELTGGKLLPGRKESGEIGRTGPIGYGRPEPKPEAKPTEAAPAGKVGYGVPEPAPGGRADTIADTRNTAMRRLQRDPRRADQLIKDLTSGKRTGVDAADETILTQQKATLQAERDRAGRDAQNLQLSQGERAEAAATFADKDTQLRDLDYATADGAIFRGQSQARAWHNFKAKDYSQEAMEQKLYVAKGGKDVTPEEKANLAKHVDRLSDMMAKEQARKVTTGWRPGAPRDPVLRDIQFDAMKAKEALDNTIFKAQFKTKSLAEKGFHVSWQVMSIPRALMASTDLSAIRRQGGIFFMSHPIRSLKAMPDMLRASKSERAYFDLMQDIRERPNGSLYAESKLALTDVTSPRLSQLEEQYMSRWASRIPIVSGSQRAYVYFLNRLRADTFDAMSMSLTRNGTPTPKQAAVISNFINVFTGRGTIPGQYANAIALFNNAFFAPRYVLSRFQAITGQPLRYAMKHDPSVVKLIAGEYARALIGYGVTYGLVATALKDYASVEWDPRSADFGKIKVGNTRIDIMSGLSQPTVFLVRSAPELFGLGKTKTMRGEVMSLGGGGAVPMTQRKYTEVLKDFVRSKLAPVPAAYLNVKEGKTVVGEPTTLTREAIRMITPISGNDIFEALRDYGLSRESALSLLTIFGDSVQTYSPKAQGRTRKRHRARER